jgi:hypothetical protein
MTSNGMLRARLIAAAAEAGVAQPQPWVEQNMWALCSYDGWAAAWSFAEDNKTVNVNQDTGMRDDVINDQMIKDAVDDLLAEQAAPPA